MNGTVRLGIDDFVRKIIENIDEIILPKLNQKVNKGELLFSIKHNGSAIDFHTPISGKINLVNSEHAEHPDWFKAKPFELSWVCCIEPMNLSEELSSLKIGNLAVNWYKDEIKKFNEIMTRVQKENLDTEGTNQKIINEFCKIFFNQTKN